MLIAGANRERGSLGLQPGLSAIQVDGNLTLIQLEVATASASGTGMAARRAVPLCHWQWHSGWPGQLDSPKCMPLSWQPLAVAAWLLVGETWTKPEAGLGLRRRRSSLKRRVARLGVGTQAHRGSVRLPVPVRRD